MTLRDRLEAIRNKDKVPVPAPRSAERPASVSPYVRRALDGRLPVKVFAGGLPIE